MSFCRKFNGRKLEESFTVEVLDGKKVIGQLLIDASNGIWPQGEWVPTTEIGPAWYEIRPDKKKKEGQVTGEVQITYSYTGETANTIQTNEKAKRDGMRDGQEYLERGEFQNAADSFASALAAYPDDDDVWSGIGVVKAKWLEVQDQAKQHNAAVKIQAIHRKKNAIKVTDARRRENELLEKMTDEEKQSVIDRRKRESDGLLNAGTLGFNNSPDFEAPQLQDDAAWQVSLRGFLSSTGWTAATVFNTTWALFAGDVALWLMNKDVDVPIAYFTFLVFCAFLFEFLGNLASKREYGALPWPDTMNMFFVLDVVGTLSLIPEFWILPMFGGEELEVPDSVILARVARAARIGARLSRLTKILRMFQPGDDTKEVSATMQRLQTAPDEEKEDEPLKSSAVTSQIGDKVAEGISKKVIVLVITLLVFVPIFTYMEPRGGLRKTKSDILGMVNAMERQDPTIKDGACSCNSIDPNDNLACQTPDGWTCTCSNGSSNCTLLSKYQLSMKKFLSFQKNRVLYFTWDRDGTWSAPMFNIRSTIDPDVCDDGYQCNQHDNSAVGMVYAKERLSILRKAEIRKFGDDDIQCTKYKKVGTSCQVICGDDHKNLENCVENDCIKTLEDFELGKVPYAKDDGEGNFKYSTAGWDCAQQMKPRPDHHSFRKVEFWIDYKAASASEAAMNILYMLFICLIFALSSLVFMMDLNVLVIEPVENMSAAMQLVSEKLLDLGGSGDGGEAAYIESSILKIVSLLKVSFGDAGTRIIANNMTADSDTIQPMVPGVKVFGCFGMIDIREFTATTEALREKVTIFVNEFGEINHSRCKETGGSPNKNVGDAFLCVWIDKDGMAPPADDVLACYRRCIQDVRQSEQLAELIELHQIKERFPPKQQEFGKYRARHGCGLHYGMAIEGAIGSARKIDASYLGPDVDLSDVLEASTKVYKVPILVSQVWCSASVTLPPPSPPPPLPMLLLHDAR